MKGGEKSMKNWHIVTYILVIVGALNWGLVGLFKTNIVELLFGFNPLLVNIVYIVVGASALAEVIMHKDCCKKCGKK